MSQAYAVVHAQYLAAEVIRLQDELAQERDRNAWLLKALAELSATRADDAAVRLVSAIDYGLERYERVAFEGISTTQEVGE